MELVLIRGLPGSGKSTLACAMAGYVWYEADHYFLDEMGVYTYKPDLIRDAHLWCQQRVWHALLQGKSVVVSNTFVQRWEIEPYLEMGQKLGIPVRLVHATGSWPSTHGVPDAVIQRMRDLWEDI
ncbi:MAG: ATP-binding protein [Gloeomargaritaceae cyanobacterium C42_A2020_066]|nr:ATP-binding protein [Gloeomargaritaceae cyanobacterium C42_A2020_066]